MCKKPEKLFLFGGFVFLLLSSEVALGVKYSIVMKSHKLLLHIVELENTMLLSVPRSYGNGSIF